MRTSPTVRIQLARFAPRGAVAPSVASRLGLGLRAVGPTLNPLLLLQRGRLARTSLDTRCNHHRGPPADVEARLLRGRTSRDERFRTVSCPRPDDFVGDRAVTTRRAFGDKRNARERCFKTCARSRAGMCQSRRRAAVDPPAGVSHPESDSRLTAACKPKAKGARESL